jgi:hypothetical protein
MATGPEQLMNLTFGMYATTNISGVHWNIEALETHSSEIRQVMGAYNRSYSIDHTFNDTMSREWVDSLWRTEIWYLPSGTSFVRDEAAEVLSVFNVSEFMKMTIDATAFLSGQLIDGEMQGGVENLPEMRFGVPGSQDTLGELAEFAFTHFADSIDRLTTITTDSSGAITASLPKSLQEAKTLLETAYQPTGFINSSFIDYDLKFSGGAYFFVLHLTAVYQYSENGDLVFPINEWQDLADPPQQFAILSYVFILP